MARYVGGAVGDTEGERAWQGMWEGLWGTLRERGHGKVHYVGGAVRERGGGKEWGRGLDETGAIRYVSDSEGAKKCV